MPAKLPDVTDKVMDRLLAFLKEAHPDHHDLIDRIAHSVVLTEVCRFTIESIGFAVANDGEIYNPAAPRPSYPQPIGVRQYRQVRRGKHKR